MGRGQQVWGYADIGGNLGVGLDGVNVVVYVSVGMKGIHMGFLGRG